MSEPASCGDDELEAIAAGNAKLYLLLKNNPFTVKLCGYNHLDLSGCLESRTNICLGFIREIDI